MLVGRFIVGNCLAMRVGNDKAFKVLVTYLRPGYNPPAKDKLSRILDRDMRAQLVDAMRKKIRAIEHIIR